MESGESGAFRDATGSGCTLAEVRECGAFWELQVGLLFLNDVVCMGTELQEIWLEV